MRLHRRPGDPRPDRGRPGRGRRPAQRRAARAGRAGDPGQGRRGRRATCASPGCARSSTTATRWRTRSRRSRGTAGGTGTRSRSAWSSRPSWPGSPAGWTTPPRPGTARCSTLLGPAGRATRPTPGPTCSPRCGWTRRPAARHAALRRARRPGADRPSWTDRPTTLLRGRTQEVAAMKAYVLNGPNLGRLGTRQVDVYGVTTYADLVDAVRATAQELGLDVEVRQTDAEHEMLGWLHAAADEQAPRWCSTRAPGRTTPTRCATPARCCAARWSRCTSPTSTPARSSGTTRWSRRWRPG